MTKTSGYGLTNAFFKNIYLRRKEIRWFLPSLCWNAGK